VYRLDIPFDFSYKPRIPGGLELGANKQFKFGGATDSGIPEIVIEQVPRQKVFPRSIGIFE
jgi:hypothetical protein